MEEMTREGTLRLVRESRLGHLGLARGGRAYVVPIFYGFDGRDFYFHSHPGLKDEYAEETDEACLSIVRARSEDDWESVLAFGRMEAVRGEAERLVAMDALLSVPLPPEFGVSELGEPMRSARATRFWRLAPSHLTGRKSVPPPFRDAVGEAGIRGG